jgi:ketosteroid isomerase-like protein
LSRYHLESQFFPLADYRVDLLLSVVVQRAATLSGRRENSVSGKEVAESYKQRDISKLSSLLSEDFIITVEDGSTFGKEGYISHSADSTVKVDLADLSELRVRVHGNTAIVTGAYHEVGTSKGKRYDYHDRLTDVWMKRNGNWQVIASHYSVPVKQ